MRLLPFVLCLVVVTTLPAQDTATTLSQLAKVYEESKTELMKPVTDLQTMYAGKLEELKAEATQNGQLNRVLAIKSEADAFRSGETPTIGDDFPKLKNLQSIYRQALPTRLQQATTALAPLTASYETKLKEMQVELTKQEKLTDALQVKAVLDAITEDHATMAKATTPEAVLNLVPEISGRGAPTEFTFKEGRLHALGRMKSITASEVDLSPAEGITDFIDVTGNTLMWVALRKNGTAIGWHVEKGSFSKSSIRKLVNAPRSLERSAWVITSEGKLTDLISGEVKDLPGPVSEAFIEEQHAIALLEDGTVHVWGALYEGPAANRLPFPKPPPEALRNISRIAASRYAAFVVTNDGDLMGWRHGEHLFKSFPRELRNITRIWAMPFEVVVEVKGKTVYQFNVDKLETEGSREYARAVAAVRVGNGGHLCFKDGQWQIGTGADKFKPLHGEPEAIAKMDGSVWPFLYRDMQDETPVLSYLLWLKAD
ncbi:MAG: hypothetical protein KDK99_04625 [Verrucomicrobiales bacterium]|nr:hypothetical protein [Verrucomicrobiales bacterium]